VVVSFSTTYQSQEAALNATLEALAQMPVCGVATLGKGLEGRKIDAPENVEIVVGASHDALLARAVAIVTHAGHGTTLRALRAGVPIVALPMGRDQNDNAARVEYHGAGLRLDPSASSQIIATALHRVIGDPAFAANAQRLSHALSREGCAARRFVEEIEAMMRRQRAKTTVERASCRVA
jgi:UDP:flavonoid glycosyltransferase YjiC (YdhE family)